MRFLFKSEVFGFGAPTTLITLTAAEGAGEQRHMGALYRAHQVLFDWLQDTLVARRTAGVPAAEQLA